MKTTFCKIETAMEQPDYFPSFQGLSSILDLIATKAFYRDLLYITQPLTYIRVEALKKGTSFPQPTRQLFQIMRENRLQVVSEGKEAARQTLKHGKQEVKRGDKKEG